MDRLCSRQLECFPQHLSLSDEGLFNNWLESLRGVRLSRLYPDVRILIPFLTVSRTPQPDVATMGRWRRPPDFQWGGTA